MKKKLKPIGKWVLVATKLGGQKTTEAGIIYNEKVTCKMVWGEVVDISPDLKPHIQELLCQIF